MPRSKGFNPTKAGRIHGKFMASPLGSVKVQKMDGSIIEHPLTRRERRLLARRLKNDKTN